MTLTFRRLYPLVMIAALVGLALSFLTVTASAAPLAPVPVVAPQPCVTITVSVFDHEGEWHEFDYEVCNEDDLKRVAGIVEILPAWGFYIVDISV